MIKRILAAAVVAFCLAPAVTSAATFSFVFDMPEFTSGSLVGQTSRLEVEVDNGGTSKIDQDFTNFDVTAMTILQLNGVDKLLEFTDYRTLSTAEHIFITTDAGGLATLNTIPPVLGAAVVWSNTVATGLSSDVQLGTDNFVEYSLTFQEELTEQTGSISSGFEVVELSPSAVPEVTTTGSVAALVSVFALMALLFERRGGSRGRRSAFETVS